MNNGLLKYYAMSENLVGTSAGLISVRPILYCTIGAFATALNPIIKAVNSSLETDSVFKGVTFDLDKTKLDT